MPRRGSMIIEVLLAIAVAGIVIASISNLVVSVDRVDRTSAHKDQAIGYARQSIETLDALVDAMFACSGASCSGFCIPRQGYSSCWKPCTPAICQPSPESITINGITFQRTITITDQTSPADSNVKNVIAQVTWSEHGQPK